MQKLFLCHFTGSDAEVTALSRELGLVGVPYWLDHNGGFGAGVNHQTEARRIIRDPAESFGLLFYAVPESFDREFIQDIELHEALNRKEEDDAFILMAVPRRMDFGGLKSKSLQKLGVDLSIFHSSPINDRDAEGINALPLRPQFADLAKMILKERLKLHLRQKASAGGADLIGINLCTRDSLPSSDDVLHIDASWMFAGEGSVNPDNWTRLLNGMVEMRQTIRQVIAKPRIRVQGSKHLTAAFLLGRVFTPPVSAEVQTRQGDEFWTSECDTGSVTQPIIQASLRDGASGNRSLYVEISTTDQNVHDGVRAYIASGGASPFVTMRIEPDGGRRRGVVTSSTACVIAKDIRESIVRAVQSHGAQDVHLFMAVPQALATFIGRQLSALPPIHLYEYVDGVYHPSCVVNQSQFG